METNVRLCPVCQREVRYTTKRQRNRSERLKKRCKSCSNNELASSRRLWYKGIRVSWYTNFYNGAKKRKIPWELTMDQVAAQFKKQQWVCNLTGESIRFQKVGKYQAAPASIDRIDSRLPYRADNIQIVLRRINMMKKEYSQAEFIRLCQLVAIREEINYITRSMNN